ncbi:MAG: FAD:protein FMN transferase [Holophagae bacterium]|nr:FAD:protein FMN transferase [Holophagae bacterium]
MVKTGKAVHVKKRGLFLFLSVLILAGFGAYNIWFRTYCEVAGTFYAMGGVPVEVKGYYISRSRFKQVFNDVRETFDCLEQEMSLFRAGSHLNQINRDAYNHAVPVKPDTWAVLNLARSVYRQSEGCFDATAEPLLALWKTASRENRLPVDKELTRIRSHIGMDKVLQDNANHTVRFSVEGIRLDLGGIAKGYMCDRGIATMRRLGVKRGLINAGGDIVVFDDRNNPEPFRIAVRSPDGQGVMEALTLTDGAVVTSGNYERYIVIEGHHYSHIVNPVTGWPADHCRSVTVTGPSGALADAWATAMAVRVSDNLPLSEMLPPGYRIVGSVSDTDSQDKGHSGI